MTAADAMTPGPLTVTAGTPPAEAAHHLLDRAANGALVVEGDRLVGIPTHSDLLRALIPRAPEAVA